MTTYANRIGPAAQQKNIILRMARNFLKYGYRYLFEMILTLKGE
jgi:hypothetical protein